MYAYNRIPNGGHSTPTPSPPASPSLKIRHGGKSRSSGGGKSTAAGFGGVPGKNYFQRATYVFLSVLHRRQAYCFFAPIIYIAITLYCMSSVIPNISDRPQPGSVYRSQQVFENLWPEINADNYSVDLRSVWQQPHKGGDWRPCTKHKDVGGLPESNGYLLVDANGGLNQQRVSICNAVAVAGYLNATLLIPSFHFHSIWKDASKFKDIYDLDHFVNSLKGVVRIAEEVPAHIMDRYDHNFSKVLNFRVKAWSNAHYYQDVVLPKLLEEKFIRISPFANRLAVDAPPAVQRLRCLANYEALQFANPITTLSEKIVERMRKLSAHNGGNYISVHLRFEEDMVAFSCCVYDWGDAERTEMAAAREKGWRGKFSKRGKIIRPGANRLNGKCPLTPVEVGLMLRGMGFSNTTSIYLASGKIYQAEKMMVPLRQMFPLLQTKNTLASPEELAPFKKFSSRMAAIDYSVCLHSEVFVTTQGGNFPHFLMGHRRYLYGGHSKTIRPDKRKLALLLDNPTIGWENFKKRMVSMLEHSDSKGVEIRRRLDAVYSYPCPDCMCRLNASEVAQI